MSKFDPIRQGLIEGRKIFVFDNLVPLENMESLTNTLKKSNFVRIGYDRDDTQGFKTWYGAIEAETAEKLPIYERTMSALNHHFPAEAYKLYRSYCNLTLYGEMLFNHHDVKPTNHGFFTALWFISQNWESEWGGETLFFNNDGDAEFVVSPRPGRLALFDGAIMHAGRPPSRICFETRFTLAFKFRAKGLQEGENSK